METRTAAPAGKFWMARRNDEGRWQEWEIRRIRSDPAACMFTCRPGPVGVGLVDFGGANA